MNVFHEITWFTTCFWSFMAGWALCHAVWCIRHRHSKPERTARRVFIVNIGRLAIPDAADPTPPVPDNSDERAPSNDDGHDRRRKADAADNGFKGVN